MRKPGLCFAVASIGTWFGKSAAASGCCTSERSKFLPSCRRYRRRLAGRLQLERKGGKNEARICRNTAPRYEFPGTAGGQGGGHARLWGQSRGRLHRLQFLWEKILVSKVSLHERTLRRVLP